MQDNLIRWALQLVVAELTKRITPETLKALEGLVVGALQKLAADFKAAAAKSESKWDDAAANALAALVDAVVKALAD